MTRILSLSGRRFSTGTTTYAYDALNRVTSVTDRRGNTQRFEYDALGRITKVTDKNGNSTSYTYDGNGNILTATDAMGTVAQFEYNANNQLVKMTQTRADSVSDLTEEQITLYEYDGRNLVTKVVHPTGANELYVYDGNGNMISKTDGDGYVTEYSYNALDLVSKINYNDAKEVTYQYNKVGELVKMNDWVGETTFELDLLGRLTRATDHKGNVVQYAYDAVGNQTSLTYPDGGVATRTYDALGNLLTVTDPEKGVYSYEYDDAGNITRLTYPNGWIEDYTYDAEGNLTKVVDTDPFVTYNKTSTKYEYDYDAEGNLTREYDRDSGETKRAQTSTYTYDALNRLTHVTETSRGYPTVERSYIYDSLGNMIQEEADECLEYHYHGTTLYESRECCERAEYNGVKRWDYTYDGRGNLVSVDKYMRTTQGMQLVNSEKYVYDETGKLVQGTNEDGEVSLYTYNGLGVRVGRELILKDNTHGYTDFHKETPSVETGLDKPEVVKESYVVDYTRATLDVLVKEETGGNTDRWLYGYQSLQVKITSDGTDWWGQDTQQDVLTAYTHHDRLGSIVNLTDKYGRNLARADYREYGEIAFYESITVNGGYRRIAPQLVYTNHEYDDVLDLYYAKARFYDPDEKRFLSMDPVKGSVTDPLSLVPYVYCVDNPLRYVDPLGMVSSTITTSQLTGGGGGFFAPYGTASVDFYMNGQNDLFIDSNGTNYVVHYNDRTYMAGYMGYDIKFLKEIGVSFSDLYRDAGGLYRYINKTKVYYEKISCFDFLPVRKAAEAAGVDNTLSWWSEHGTPTVVFNTAMKDSPVKVVREGDKVHITIYARFEGDHADDLYDNSDDALDLHLAQGMAKQNFNSTPYISQYTYSELVAKGVTDKWSVTVSPQKKSTNVYDDFGGYQAITVDVKFYADKESQSGYISQGNPSPNQRYITINVDTDTPKKRDDLPSFRSLPDKVKDALYSEFSNTSRGDGGWSINNQSTVNLYDHYTKYWTDSQRQSQWWYPYYWAEYDVHEYMKTAAHEFGHVFGLGDAYNVGWHEEAVQNAEVDYTDIMRTNKIVSPNDIEMLLEAWKLNEWQEFVGDEQSPVIRYK